MSDLTILIIFKDPEFSGGFLELDYNDQGAITQEALHKAFDEYVRDNGIWDEEMREFLFDVEIHEVKQFVPLSQIVPNPNG